jgi:hypothetical protein
MELCVWFVLILFRFCLSHVTVLLVEHSFFGACVCVCVCMRVDRLCGLVVRVPGC